jgi:2-amino-4-hydroxy-6-hydroxymethyldihydropteridine diphosphokinase
MMTDRSSESRPVRSTGSAGRAYVGLGANLGERCDTIRRAVELLGQAPETAVVAVSTFRETAPVGLEDQPAFMNGACAVETTLSPRTLLDELLSIELRLGRTRSEVRWGPRIIDLDLLLYDQFIVDEPGLVIPHPRLRERVFVLEPLLDIDPNLSIPDGRTVKSLLAAIK